MKDQRERIFSGIQPSGEIHIGNYLGAIQNWVELGMGYECYYCIVDYHAMTAKYDAGLFRARVWETILSSISCGVDWSCLFIQSHVPEHTELGWILNTLTPMGQLERMTQYKDKSRNQKENVNAGLLTYPVLQAADILLYKGEKVPVGKDQVQHIELVREIVRIFNGRYGEVFIEPKELLSKVVKVKGLDGKEKMSKSRGNGIGLNEGEEEVRGKIMKAVTDENRKRRTDPGDPGVCNIYEYHGFFSLEEEVLEIGVECRVGRIGCVDCKKILHRNLWAELEKIQEVRRGLDLGEVKEVIYENGARFRKVAKRTMEEVKEKVGLI